MLTQQPAKGSAITKGATVNVTIGKKSIIPTN